MEKTNPVSLLLKYLAGFGGTIGVLTTVLYGAGFLVTRAHYSMLGIWSGIPIVKEAYLYEGGLFFLFSIYYLTMVVPLALLLMGILYGLKKLFLLVVHGLSKRTKKIKRAQWPASREPLLTKIPLKLRQSVVPILAIILFPFFYSQSLFIKGLLFYTKRKISSAWWWWPADSLQQHVLEGHQNILHVYYGGLVWGTVAMGFLVCYGQWKNDEFIKKALRFAVGMTFLVQVLLLPLNYGILIKPTIYPKAYVDTQKMVEEEVWLLSETPQELIVYRDNPPKKEISLVKKDEIDELDIIDHRNILKEPLYFKLTNSSFQGLKDDGVPDPELERLKRLEDKEFTTEHEFLDAVENQIGEQQTVRYKDLILKYAKKSIKEPESRFVTHIASFQPYPYGDCVYFVTVVTTNLSSYTSPRTIMVGDILASSNPSLSPVVAAEDVNFSISSNTQSSKHLLRVYLMSQRGQPSEQSEYAEVISHDSQLEQAIRIGVAEQYHPCAIQDVIFYINHEVPSPTIGKGLWERISGRTPIPGDLSSEGLPPNLKENPPIAKEEVQLPPLREWGERLDWHIRWNSDPPQIARLHIFNPTPTHQTFSLEIGDVIKASDPNPAIPLLIIGQDVSLTLAPSERKIVDIIVYRDIESGQKLKQLWKIYEWVRYENMADHSYIAEQIIRTGHRICAYFDSTQEAIFSYMQGIMPLTDEALAVWKTAFPELKSVSWSTPSPGNLSAMSEWNIPLTDEALAVWGTHFPELEPVSWSTPSPGNLSAMSEWKITSYKINLLNHHGGNGDLHRDQNGWIYLGANHLEGGDITYKVDIGDLSQSDILEVWIDGFSTFTDLNIGPAVFIGTGKVHYERITRAVQDAWRPLVFRFVGLKCKEDWRIQYPSSKYTIRRMNKSPEAFLDNQSLPIRISMTGPEDFIIKRIEVIVLRPQRDIQESSGEIQRKNVEPKDEGILY